GDRPQDGTPGRPSRHPNREGTCGRGLGDGTAAQGSSPDGRRLPRARIRPGRNGGNPRDGAGQGVRSLPGLRPRRYLRRIPEGRLVRPASANRSRRDANDRIDSDLSNPSRCSRRTSARRDGASGRNPATRRARVRLRLDSGDGPQPGPGPRGRTWILRRRCTDHPGPALPLDADPTKPDAALDPQVVSRKGTDPRKRTLGQAIRRPAGVHNTCSLVMPSPSERRLMIQIDIEVPDRPGELAKLAAILGTAGINIEAIGGESASGRSYVSLIVSQPVQAREALMKHGYVCSTWTVLVVRLDDKPGALAALAKKLGDAGVNVTSAIHLGTVGGHAQLALGVDNLEKARSLV